MSDIATYACMLLFTMRNSERVKYGNARNLCSEVYMPEVCLAVSEHSRSLHSYNTRSIDLALR